VSVKKGTALDFGCGVGRLTQALCQYFERCIGVDIAGSMIKLAWKYNRFGDRCHYLVNDVGDLRMFEDGHFDFIYSNIVLQHIPSEYSTHYIREFVRLLSPGGMAVFQMPSHVAGGSRSPAIDTMFSARITTSPQTLTATTGAKMQIVANVRNTSAYSGRHGARWRRSTSSA